MTLEMPSSKNSLKASHYILCISDRIIKVYALYIHEQIQIGKQGGGRKTVAGQRKED
jgi:hypothetical protein